MPDQDAPVSTLEQNILLQKADICAMFHVNHDTVTRWCKAGKLPYYKIGKMVRFNLASVMAHLEAHPIQ